ncbi:hypothetical protein UA32_12240 [Photobacterium angustum]|uniref:Uncharacterized protein n=1 Tax=Photobacterium angustum TaxID=661 RepID=A0ABX5GZ32_PHOAN|nr:hypothetical protein [Photobacterium angustum]KJG37722.1 hypothetical protein UA32_12240 [Photobacterium angustum]PSX03944.1 hypothetical protein C0W27_20840 [Photobacterium angustum]
MRIPIVKADWPKSFNSTAKYIGRHWPKGKLTLSKSREVSAKLMGYHSVHDVARELQESLPDRCYSTKSMAASMAVKSVLLYGLPPVASYQFFSAIPWVNLTVWRDTSEYRYEQLRTQGRLVLDEYHGMMSYYTPSLLADAWVQGKIPKFEFTLDKDGMMFDRRQLERILEFASPSEEDLEECGSSLSVEDYFNTHILPNAWCPVEEAISRLNPNDPVYWMAPEFVEIIKVDDDSYVLRNEQLSAFYPGTYTSNELAESIAKLFKLDTISDIETECEISLDKYGRECESEKFGMHGSFILDDQVYYRQFKLNDYSAFVENPFIDFLLDNITFKNWFSIPESVLCANKLAAINKAYTVLDSIMDSSPNGNQALVNLGVSDVLPLIYRSCFYDLESLKAEDQFNIENRYFEDAAEELEAKKELSELIAYCDVIGSEVLNLMPELKAYYDPRVIGYRYQQLYSEYDYDEWQHEESSSDLTLERRTGFFISMITDHLCNEFNQSAKGIASQSVRWLLVSVENGIITLEELKSGFQRMMDMYSMFNDDEDVLKKIASFCNKPKLEPCGDFINHGREYKPTFKSDVDQRYKRLSDLYKLCRSANAKSVYVTQTTFDK